MRYFLDTEFNEFGGDLISLALVAESGRELYLATRCPSPGAWVKENVLPIVSCPGAHPIMIDPDQFGRAVAIWLETDSAPIIVADWPDDIKYFCQAMITGPGEMVAIPRLQFQMLRLDAYPTTMPGAVQHNALWDARALQYALSAFFCDTAGGSVMTPGQKIVEEAFAAYDAWCREWDPDSEMSIENQAANYSKWCALQTEIERLKAQAQKSSQIYHDTQWRQLQEANAEIERLRNALNECTKDSHFDDFSLEFYPTRGAKIALETLALTSPKGPEGQ